LGVLAKTRHSAHHDSADATGASILSTLNATVGPTWMSTRSATRNEAAGLGNELFCVTGTGRLIQGEGL
jgi:hypothetical protein